MYPRGDLEPPSAMRQLRPAVPGWRAEGGEGALARRHGAAGEGLLRRSCGCGVDLAARGRLRRLWGGVLCGDLSRSPSRSRN